MNDGAEQPAWRGMEQHETSRVLLSFRRLGIGQLLQLLLLLTP